jgi:hypothetical protein
MVLNQVTLCTSSDSLKIVLFATTSCSLDEKSLLEAGFGLTENWPKVAAEEPKNAKRKAMR